MIAYLFLYFLVWEIFDSIYATVSEPDIDIKRKYKQESYKLHTPKSLEISLPHYVHFIIKTHFDNIR